MNNYLKNILELDKGQMLYTKFVITSNYANDMQYLRYEINVDWNHLIECF